MKKYNIPTAVTRYLKRDEAVSYFPVNYHSVKANGLALKSVIIAQVTRKPSRLLI